MDLAAGTATGSDAGSERLMSIENVESRPSPTTSSVGDASAGSSLLSGDGDDRLAGREGDDFLDSSNGSDYRRLRVGARWESLSISYGRYRDQQQSRQRHVGERVGEMSRADSATRM